MYLQRYPNPSSVRVREISMQIFNAALLLIKSPQLKKSIANQWVDSIKPKLSGVLAMQSINSV